MKKPFILKFFFPFFTGFSHTDYYDRMEHIFGNIDKAKSYHGFSKRIWY